MTDPSNALRVDCIILPMCADKPDVDDPIGIIDPHNDPVFVARDIEHSAAIPEDAGTADIPLNVGWLRPVCLPDLPKPGHHRPTGIGYAFAAAEKCLDHTERNNP